MSLSWAEELMGYIEGSSENPEYEGGFESELCRGFQIRDSRSKLVKIQPMPSPPFDPNEMIDFMVDALDERTEK